MSISLARTLAGLGLVAFSLQASLAGASDAPSKDDIIKALMSKDTATSRGFVQVPGAASPAAPATTAAQPAAAHIDRPAAPAASHAVPASAPVPAARTTADGHASIGVPILFERNSATISSASRSTLENIAAALKSAGLDTSKIRLEGHTDGSGSAEINQQLSEQRAVAVREFLVQNGGVDADRLIAVGKGSSEPANPADPFAAENRRVVLVNLNN